MAGCWHRYNRGIKIVFIYFIKWVFLINKWTNTYTNKQIFRYWFNFYWSNKSITEYRVHRFLHSNCHHQNVLCSFNLNICYPSPYQRQVLNYKKADSTNIRKGLDLVNWAKLFDQKDMNAQVSVLNETIWNVFQNYVSSKCITANDKNHVWMDKSV